MAETGDRDFVEGGPRAVDNNDLRVISRLLDRTHDILFAGTPDADDMARLREAHDAARPVILGLIGAPDRASKPTVTASGGDNLRCETPDGMVLRHTLEDSTLWVQIPTLAEDESSACFVYYSGEPDPCEGDPEKLREVRERTAVAANAAKADDLQAQVDAYHSGKTATVDWRDGKNCLYMQRVSTAGVAAEPSVGDAVLIDAPVIGSLHPSPPVYTTGTFCVQCEVSAPYVHWVICERAAHDAPLAASISTPEGLFEIEGFAKVRAGDRIRLAVNGGWPVLYVGEVAQELRRIPVVPRPTAALDEAIEALRGSLDEVEDGDALPEGVEVEAAGEEVWLDLDKDDGESGWALLSPSAARLIAAALVRAADKAEEHASKAGPSTTVTLPVGDPSLYYGMKIGDGTIVPYVPSGDPNRCAEPPSSAKYEVKKPDGPVTVYTGEGQFQPDGTATLKVEAQAAEPEETPRTKLSAPGWGSSVQGVELDPTALFYPPCEGPINALDQQAPAEPEPDVPEEAPPWLAYRKAPR